MGKQIGDLSHLALTPDDVRDLRELQRAQERENAAAVWKIGIEAAERHGENGAGLGGLEGYVRFVLKKYPHELIRLLSRGNKHG